MNIHLVFLELLHADVYKEESMHILKDFGKRRRRKKIVHREFWNFISSKLIPV